MLLRYITYAALSCWTVAAVAHAHQAGRFGQLWDMLIAWGPMDLYVLWLCSAFSRPSPDNKER